ncbi:hypothetical protein [Kitasatospora azatica]|uniref:hypothetical protein n=1 Tax=Kitasatospora azatica TaxID=58347 RepID=UPI00055FFF48|nr:hypothetical protein [Kitasatospora azatica]
MTIPRIGKRLIATAAAAASLGAVAVIGTASPAAASTISNGNVQVCAQGTYPVYAQFPYRGGWSTTIVNPGNCWLHYVGGNSWEPINVYGLYPNSSATFSLGTFWYDGAVSGIGIGGEGTPWQHDTYIW